MLLVGQRGPLDVAEGSRLLRLLLEFGQAAAVLRLRPRVEDFPGIARSGRDQAGLDALRGSLGGMLARDEFERVQFTVSLGQGLCASGDRRHAELSGDRRSLRGQLARALAIAGAVALQQRLCPIEARARDRLACPP